MGRMHLFEFGDMAWFPRGLHRYMTDYLAFVQSTAGSVMQQLVGPVDRLLMHTRERRVVDLCSGAGGMWPLLSPYMARSGNGPVQVTLTDLVPNLPAMEQVRAASNGHIDFVATSVDATRMPDELRGARTIFNGFHHLQPEQARAVLANAAASGQPIGVFEVLGRNPAQVLTAPLILLVVLLVTPFIRPFRLGRLVFTYLIPVLPLAIFWDGLVSALRCYSADELRALTESIDTPAGYQWEIGTLRVSGIGVPYLLGYPARAA